MSEQDPIINWTPDKLAALKRAQAHAIETKQDQFKFEGHDMLVSYAKYLIEYLETQFGKGT
jgi:hypothetical protein